MDFPFGSDFTEIEATLVNPDAPADEKLAVQQVLGDARVTRFAQVEIGGNERYVPVSRKEFKDVFHGGKRVRLIDPASRDPALVTTTPEYNPLLLQYLVDQAMLNIDAARIGPRKIPNEFLKRRRLAVRVF